MCATSGVMANASSSSEKAGALDFTSAGSENSDQGLSGNSGHLSVALPGQIVGDSASDEGKDDRHAQATRDSGAAAGGSHVAGGGRPQRRGGTDREANRHGKRGHERR